MRPLHAARADGTAPAVPANQSDTRTVAAPLPDGKPLWKPGDAERWLREHDDDYRAQGKAWSYQGWDSPPGARVWKYRKQIIPAPKHEIVLHPREDVSPIAVSTVRARIEAELDDRWTFDELAQATRQTGRPDAVRRAQLDELARAIGVVDWKALHARTSHPELKPPRLRPRTSLDRMIVDADPNSALRRYCTDEDRERIVGKPERLGERYRYERWSVRQLNYSDAFLRIENAAREGAWNYYRPRRFSKSDLRKAAQAYDEAGKPDEGLDDYLASKAGDLSPTKAPFRPHRATERVLAKALGCSERTVERLRQKARETVGSGHPSYIGGIMTPLVARIDAHLHEQDRSLRRIENTLAALIDRTDSTLSGLTDRFPELEEDVHRVRNTLSLVELDEEAAA
jgi:hypothetical protein